MDLSQLQALIPNLAGFLHVEPASLLLFISLLVAGCNVAGRMIPDDARGPLGVVRSICKLVGLYTANRVATGITVNDITRSVISKADPEVVALAEDADSLIQQVTDSPVVKAFPGIVRGADGKSAKKDD